MTRVDDDRPADLLHLVSMQMQQVRRPGRLTKAMQKLGLHDRRNMLWSWTPGEPRNFGDWIGPLIFAARRGRPPLHHKLKENGAGRAYFAAGSIMGQIKRPDAAIVWGSGIMRRDQAFERPREIRAVRGPLTRTRCLELGYDCPEIYGDPALLLPRLFGKPPVEVTSRLGIIPHFVNLDEAREAFRGIDEVRVVDVTRPTSEVVAEIRSCEVTVSSSLHGLIVSHAYGLRSAWVTFGTPLRGDGVKFHDYYLSGRVEEPPSPTAMPEDIRVEELMRLAAEAPQPRLQPLEDSLLEACPF